MQNVNNQSSYGLIFLKLHKDLKVSIKLHKKLKVSIKLHMFNMK